MIASDESSPPDHVVICRLQAAQISGIIRTGQMDDLISF